MVAKVLTGLAALMVVAGGLAYAARRPIVEALAVRWLRAHGVEGAVSVEDLSRHAVSGSIRIGDEASPDLVVDRVELDLEIGSSWSRDGLGFGVSHVRLLRPTLATRLTDRGFDLGAVEPLLTEVARLSDGSETTLPYIEVDDARVRLSTSAGEINLRGSAVVREGRLVRATATVLPATMHDGRFGTDLAHGSIDVRTSDDATHVDVGLELDELAAAGFEVKGVTARLRGVTGAARRSGSGVEALVLDAAVQADSVSTRHGSARHVDLDLSFLGSQRGGLTDFGLQGTALLRGTSVDVTAGAVSGREIGAEVGLALVSLERAAGGARGGVLGWVSLSSARVRSPTLGVKNLRADFGAVELAAGRGQGLQASAAHTVRADEVTKGPLRLRGVEAHSRSTLQWQDRLRGTTQGSLLARSGSWTIAGSSPRAQGSLAALRRALEDFRLDVPSLRLDLERDGVRLALGEPARIEPTSGGSVLVSSYRDEPLYEGVMPTGRGSLYLAASGAGLPDVRLAVPRYQLGEHEGAWSIEADASGTAALSAGPVRDAVVSGAGSLRMTPSGVEFSSTRCLDVSAAQIGHGAATMTRAYGGLCPASGPMLRYAQGAWTFAGRVARGEAEVERVGMRVERVTGLMRASGGRSSPRIRLRVDRVRIVDHEERVRPVDGTGTMTMNRGQWRASFELHKKDRRIATVQARHDVASRSGQLTIDGGGLAFGPAALQPTDLFPMADGLIEAPVTGIVDLSATFDWSPKGLASRGRLRTAGLDFRSPLGFVSDLRAELELPSLTPIITAPEQTVVARRVVGPVSIGRSEAAITLVDDTLLVERGEFSVLDGRATLDPLLIALGRNKTWDGTVRFEGVDLEHLVESSSLGKRMDFEARVNGRMDFSVGPRGFRIADGRIVGVAPGRLSIDPTLLSGAGAKEGRITPGTDEGLSGLAHQALEHLAFEHLDGVVTSFEGGRLGARFFVRGRHDPPQRQEIELRWIDLLRRRFDDDLRLPSGTEIDLTLDTHWNFGDLLEGLPVPLGGQSPRVVQTTDRKRPSR